MVKVRYSKIHFTAQKVDLQSVWIFVGLYRQWRSIVAIDVCKTEHKTNLADDNDVDQTQLISDWSTSPMYIILWGF